MPFADTEAMQAHLAEISIAIAPDAHAVLVLDQAGWHMSSRRILDNITLLPLPPRSPELNPAENIWQFMRQNWLSNRVFADYDDIVAHCCEAWNKLAEAVACETAKHTLPVELRASAEHRLGLKPVRRRVRAPIGARPVASATTASSGATSPRSKRQPAARRYGISPTAEPGPCSSACSPPSPARPAPTSPA